VTNKRKNSYFKNDKKGKCVKMKSKQIQIFHIYFEP